MNTERLFHRKHKFHLSVVVGVLVIVGIMAVTTVSTILSVASRSAESTAQFQFELTSRSIKEKTVSQIQPALSLALVAASVPEIDAEVVGGGLEHPARQLFTGMLQAYPAFYSVYVGFHDGSFLQVINADENALILEAHNAPEKTAIIIRSISVGAESPVQSWTYLDRDGVVLSEKSETDFTYNPANRSWFEDAEAESQPVLSSPYQFNSLKQPGITASQAIPGKTGVVGIDLTLSSLSDFVESQYVSPNGGVALFTSELESIAASPGISSFLAEPGFTDLLNNNRDDIDSLQTISENLILIRDWNVTAKRGLLIITQAPMRDFMDVAIEMRTRIVLLSAFILIITIPIVFVWSLGLSRALKELAADAELVGNMIFDGELTVHTPIYEYYQLARAFEVMKETIADRTRALEESNDKLEMLVDMGIAMSAEFDINRLSEMILSNAKTLANADGGSLYLVDEDRKQLKFQIVLNDTLGFIQGGTSGNPISMRPVNLYDSDGKENHHNVVTHIFHTEKTENIADAYEKGVYDFSGTKIFDKENNYKSVSFLTVPLKPRGGGEILGALQLINAIDPLTGEIIPFPENLQGFVEALSSAAAVAVQNWKLMESQKHLFDELVRFVASAIDGKSPYTARHCERVPEIAKMLADAAEESDSGSLADFRFENREQRREFKIAAWLHDCGKVTTPEYIVDKATKLETIYNRLHEIRTRFEILLRDATIRRHESVINGLGPGEADAILSSQVDKLHDDFEFVARCNVGSEYMSDKALDRLRDIAAINWLRHFDNRIGLSWGELRQLSATAGPEKTTELPVTETLIGDRPELIIPREDWTQERYKKLGFRFTVPDCMYNRGELYNLSVRSGTLTDEDRFKINEHVAQTIIMLNHIPFPDDLKNVIEYAGDHHESPDGSGYPRNLDSPDISIPSHILAIADIFEALTSTDRPYKFDKTLSETIEIMYLMKQEGQIDPDLFDLLLSSGVYLQYAETYLKPTQIDEVDIGRYLSQ